MGDRQAWNIFQELEYATQPAAPAKDPTTVSTLVTNGRLIFGDGTSARASAFATTHHHAKPASMSQFERLNQFDFIDEWRMAERRKILKEFDRLLDAAGDDALEVRALEAIRDSKIIAVEKDALTQKFIAAAVAKRLDKVWGQRSGPS
ncbi:hypothetical protein [Geminicoccus flavidas]|uniref:hypothetical protein n=1 Tax=Geminicoccus flavidas TaxID=2506407 RepID=UPI00135B1274|nr:hypothetical protein [Geminicoccus flavidas]